ncbi:MAG TPA: GNAT family N-acetyltransferase [Candidatus Krumholzibacteriaceae bacterium]|nr:GNAT family N-acetyltransferase [Candidatus Krumholzibacteriaceae bacterium]
MTRLRGGLASTHTLIQVNPFHMRNTMGDSGYIFKKPRTDAEVEQVYALMRIVFPHEDVDGIVRRLLGLYPPMTLDHLFAVTYGDETVASLVLIPQTWVMDGVERKVAEMGCVATHPDHRGRGLQRMLNERFDEAARNGGYDLCALAGIPFFYRQFGYEYSLDLDHKTLIPVNELQDTQQSLESRGFAEADIPAAAELLDSYHSRYMVHCPRTAPVWRMQHMTGIYNGEPYEGYTLHEGGEVQAYVRVHPRLRDKTLVLKEAGAVPGAHRQVLAFLRRHCVENGFETLVSALGYVDPLSELLVELGAEQSLPYGWQVKIVDNLRLLEKIAPLLESRLAGTRFSGLCERLNLNFRRFSVDMVFESGKVAGVSLSSDCSDRTIGLNPYVFPQLLLGYRSREELQYAYPDVRVAPSRRELVDALFPKRPSYIHHVY